MFTIAILILISVFINFVLGSCQILVIFKDDDISHRVVEAKKNNSKNIKLDNLFTQHLFLFLR